MNNSEYTKGLVSVGMATRNRSFCIGEAIDSILNQTYENLELIISDNVSDDATREICERYAKKDRRVRFFRQERDIGSWANCSFVMKEAKGEFFMRADDDDLRDPQVIEKAVNKLNSDPEIVMVFGDMYCFDPKTGRRTDYSSEKFFPFERERYARLKRYISFYFNEGKGLLLFGLWRRSVLGNALPRAYYYGWDANIVLEALIQGPFGYLNMDFFNKGAKVESNVYTSGSRIFRSFANRMGKFFSPFFYVNLAIIALSRDLTLWEKIRLACFELFVMARLFFVRRT